MLNTNKFFNVINVSTVYSKYPRYEKITFSCEHQEKVACLTLVEEIKHSKNMIGYDHTSGIAYCDFIN